MGYGVLTDEGRPAWKGDRMKNTWMIVWTLLLGVQLCSDANAAAPPTPEPSLKKMELQNEKMKLENERLKLEIEKMKVEKENAPEKSGIVVAPSAKKAIKMEAERLQNESAQACAALAEAAKADLSKVILDFNNGELWYKGVRSSLNDFHELVKREEWKSTRSVDKRNSHGYGFVRDTYRNISAGKYEHKKRGAFTWTASAEEGAFSFETPEGLTNESSYDDFRNKFEGPYYAYDGSGYKSKMSFLRFKHKVKFTEFGEKVRFWFDKEKRLVKVEWGVLDEN
jgi:hypothetical protein